MRWTVLCLVLAGAHLSAQDMVTIAPAESTSGEFNITEEMPEVKPTIRSMKVTSNIKYRYATTLVSTRVINPESRPGQAVFHITLPESAFISEFLMVIKDEVYKAYVKEKEEAKAVYDQAVQAGQFAGHVALDARDSNQFSVSVNIEAHGKVTFNLTYEQLLSRNLGHYSNIININPQQIVDDMSVTVNIEEPTAITTLEVPELQMSNEATPDYTKQNALAKIEEKSPSHKVITWAPTPEEQRSQNSTGVSGQFIVRYDVDRKDNPQQILVNEGYFVHFFAPEDLPKLRKHVVFVLDYSGSMEGRKLQQLKDAMNKILSDLEPTDYFSIVIFQSIVEVWSPKQIYSDSNSGESSRYGGGGWIRHRSKSDSENVTLNQDFVVAASPANIDLARTYLINYSDLGATNIMGGLRTGLKLVNIGSEQWINESDPPQPVMVFLTDGQPNVEEYDTDVIINKTRPLNNKEAPIFSLAFGYGADLNFLRKLSLSNNGFARNIYEAADASDQLKNFYQTIASPLMSNVTFTYLPGQVDNTTSTTKRVFPIFFRGSELVVAGRIKQDSVQDQQTLGELSGVSATGLQTYPIICRIIEQPENRTVGYLEKTWAYLTIQQLLDKADSLDTSAEKNETKAKALKLALQYSFVTPLTSLVVVKPNETESAVDTTQVKPGSHDEAYPQAMYIGGPVGAPGYAAAMPQNSPGYYNRPLPAVAFQRYPAPSIVHRKNGPPHQILPQSPAPSMALDTAERLDLDDMLSFDEKAINPEPTVSKVNLSEILWLQNSLSSDNSTVTVQNHQYKLALNETDVSFGACQVDSQPGECHHFQFCALSVFSDDVSKYLPYQCPIPGDFLGVCCPAGVHRLTLSTQTSTTVETSTIVCDLQ